MTGSVTPSLVIVDIRPAHWTWEWLMWILNPNGDADTRQHRSWLHVGRLTEQGDDELLAHVEDVIGMRTNPFEG